MWHYLTLHHACVPGMLTLKLHQVDYLKVGSDHRIYRGIAAGSLVGVVGAKEFGIRVGCKRF